MNHFVETLLLGFVVVAMAQVPGKWKNHDPRRPERPVILPATPSSQELVGNAPSDAIVLFDGTQLDHWVDAKGKPTKWIISSGQMECTPGSGSVFTKRGFGDCQLHIEFACPTPPKGDSQGRGNSGVFLMNTYEVQVLDSYKNRTYSDGQCAAIYGQYPPIVNACLPPGQWQTYDIIFHRPHFDDRGNLISKARITVIHNGVLVQDDVEILGPNPWMDRPPYKVHADKLPLSLQDHGNPVRYRNIWLRELPERNELPGDAFTLPADKQIILPPEKLERYVGKYQGMSGGAITISREESTFFLSMNTDHKLVIIPESETKFNAVVAAIELEFSINGQGQIEGMTIRHSGSESKMKKLN